MAIASDTSATASPSTDSDTSDSAPGPVPADASAANHHTVDPTPSGTSHADDDGTVAWRGMTFDVSDAY